MISLDMIVVMEVESLTTENIISSNPLYANWCTRDLQRPLTFYICIIFEFFINDVHSDTVFFLSGLFHHV